ncbi:unnamed protein product [Schistosoma curassoni]|nr:unnamed protein product [Schistosoma curassoni]
MKVINKLNVLKKVYREYRMVTAADDCEPYEKLLINTCMMLILCSLFYMAFLLIPGNVIILYQFLFDCFK